MLWEYVKKANINAFNVDVKNQVEIQFTEYTAEQSDHYDWHHDVHWSGETDFDRKISITLQLSDPKEYDGGDFEFDEINTNADFKTKGTLLIFPSYLRHRVLPVTSGVRRSLVAWFWGPKWK
jgi:PKHD-type hydroxylase